MLFEKADGELTRLVILANSDVEARTYLALGSGAIVAIWGSWDCLSRSKSISLYKGIFLSWWYEESNQNGYRSDRDSCCI